MIYWPRRLRAKDYCRNYKVFVSGAQPAEGEARRRPGGHLPDNSLPRPRGAVLGSREEN